MKNIYILSSEEVQELKDNVDEIIWRLENLDEPYCFRYALKCAKDIKKFLTEGIDDG